MKIEFPVTLTAADTQSRVIAGRIVQFDAQGNTSAGATIFEKDSINFGKNIKLLLEHQRSAPIGKLMEWSQDETGITASFKIAETTAGSDALIEASTGLRDNFSVGVTVDAWTNKNGVMAIQKSQLVEVSLVTDGAIPGSVVERVAASQLDEEVSESSDSEVKTEGDKVSDTVSEAPAATEAVEAAKVEAAAPRPAFYATPRSPIVNAGSYLEHSIKAQLGNQDSALFVRAADDSFSTETGNNPVQYLNEFLGTAQRSFGRPTIEACGGATPHAFIGTTISIPKTGTAPTVASTAEAAAPSETGMTTSYLTGTATKYAGLNRFSVELLDLQGSPAFYNELLNEMTAAYAKATNAAVIAAITAGGTLATSQATTAAGLIAYVAKEAPAAYAGTGNFANAYVAGASQWELMLGATDSAGRPIFNAYVPQNSGGTVTPGSARGSVLGLDLFVDNGMVSTTIDDSAFIIAPNSIGIYEQAPRTITVQKVTNLQVEVSIHGYLATIVKRATGLRRYNMTA